ncbi:hypothetical protein P280DRAFT_512330 [Massarina eburnea CBS 473.64]|uniref:Uncharacterized protein n=1 Tax=Massarina eburnea CBS 473.64 TaxID=1395130 RepID=A0A6A6SGS3_9PLEO|nr:hypothetical protein P280DRAFT_512330 [Massarina eburnea CBS 473.64]
MAQSWPSDRPSDKRNPNSSGPSRDQLQETMRYLAVLAVLAYPVRSTGQSHVTGHSWAMLTPAASARACLETVSVSKRSGYIMAIGAASILAARPVLGQERYAPESQSPRPASPAADPDPGFAPSLSADVSAASKAVFPEAASQSTALLACPLCPISSPANPM